MAKTAENFMPLSPRQLLETYKLQQYNLSHEETKMLLMYNIQQWTTYYFRKGRTISDICREVEPMIRCCEARNFVDIFELNRQVARKWHEECGGYNSATEERNSPLFREQCFKSAMIEAQHKWESQSRLFHFGIDELDLAIGGGAGRGELMSVIGNPGSMKTSLLLNGITSWINDGGSDIVFFSLDMGKAKIYQRLLARSLFCSPQQAMAMKVTSATEYKLAVERLSKFYNGKLEIKENDYGKSCEWSIDTIREYIEKKSPEVVCIDYLTMLKSSRQNDFEIANSATRELVGLAQTYGCIMVVLSQMSVESQRQQAQGGMGGSARGGGYVNERADIEIELFKDSGVDQFGRDAETDIVATVKKCRKGRGGVSFRLDCIPEQLRFKSTATRTSRVKKQRKIFGNADTSWHTKLSSN